MPPQSAVQYPGAIYHTGSGNTPPKLALAAIKSATPALHRWMRTEPAEARKENDIKLIAAAKWKN